MSDPDENGRGQGWHITRGVPVALIVTMTVMFVTQIVTAAWFAARLDARVDVLEKAQLVFAPQGERLTRVEEKLENVKAGIADIKALLQARDGKSR